MSSEFGKDIKISVFGQSHGRAIGVLMDGLPVGEEIDESALRAFLTRRAPGRNALSTARREEDEPVFLSGLVNGKTCGAPLCAIIENKDARSDDYEAMRITPRPGHADYPAHVRYEGANDVRGGGHFSGRLTAPLCIAGGICMQILSRRGIAVGAHIASIGNVNDVLYDPVCVDAGLLGAVSSKAFPVIDDASGEKMQRAVIEAAQDGDSLGGTIECAVLGMPVGVGDPMFGGVENRLSYALFGIPAVKGIAFGSGFSGSLLYGSQNNDAYFYEGGAVKTKTNNHGGVLGGITTGMPIVMRVAIKPTPSIAKEQDTVDIMSQTGAKLSIKGRHDPCIVPRAVPCVEAVVAAVILDMLEGQKK